MSEFTSRTEMLLGERGTERLKSNRVAVFGLGGVGSYVVEALARCGVGALDLIDCDVVSASNLNRQIFALRSTVDRYKVDVAAERVRDINPACVVRTYRTFFSAESAKDFDFAAFDYVVDAIDTVSGKLAIVLAAKESGTPVIGVMGTGNKLDPSALRVTDIFSTSVCPLARVMRRELKKRGVTALKVVCSDEPPIKPHSHAEIPIDELPPQTEKKASGEGTTGETESMAATGEETLRVQKSVPGSVAFVPAVAGLLAAAEVVKDLLVL